MLKIDRKSYKNIGIYNTGYIAIKKIDDCENIYSMNPLYLLANHANGYIEEKSVNKYLIFDSAVGNKELLKKYNYVLNGTKNKIDDVSSGECDYEKDYMKTKFNSDDDLPLNKPLIIRSVFEENGKLYQQLFLDDTLYETYKNGGCKQRIKTLEYDRIDISEGIDVYKANSSKECDICHYW